VFEAHRRLYLSTLVVRVIKKKKSAARRVGCGQVGRRAGLGTPTATLIKLLC